MNTNIKNIKLCNLQNSHSSHQKLAELYHEMHNFKEKTLFLDFKNVTFISANQFSVLGCIISGFHMDNPDVVIRVGNISSKLAAIMKVNGFGRHLSFAPLPDKNNTAIPYKIFNVSEIDAFEKYITISIFSREDLPQMSSGVRDSIIDNILEIFNNVKEHTHSEHLYTCGQFFPRMGLLYFTITDSGETIPHNVEAYCREFNIDLSAYESSLAWAMQSGNSTRQSGSPGGLGLYLLSDFIRLNQGELYIVSGYETFEQSKKGKRYQRLSLPFPGTIVTMAFNLSDSSSYCLASEKNIDLIF